VRALLLGGFGGQGLVVALNVVQLQTLQSGYAPRSIAHPWPMTAARLSPNGK